MRKVRLPFIKFPHRCAHAERFHSVVRWFSRTNLGQMIQMCTHALHVFITMTSQWARWRLKSSASRLFIQPFIQAQIKESIKVPRHWPLCGEFTGDRWFPRTNGQLRGKCFHLMTSSCSNSLHNYKNNTNIIICISYQILCICIHQWVSARLQ